MSDTEPKPQGQISRRDFLKLLGVGAAVVGGGEVVRRGIKYLGEAAREAEAGVDWETDLYSKIDFVNHPEWLVDNPMLVGRIKKDVLDLSVVVDSFLRRETVFEGMAEQGTDSVKWQEKAVGLVDKTVRWATNLVESRERNFTNALYEVENKYLEQAYYLHTILSIYEAHRNDKPEALDAYLRSVPFSENNANVVTQQNSLLDKPVEGVARSNIHTVWAYDWKTLVSGGLSLNPTIEHYFDWEGNVLDWIPNKNADKYFSEEHTPVEKDPRTLNRRPKEAIVLNFDSEVQKEVSALLRSVGIERGLRSVNWYIAGYPQGFTDPEGNTSVGGEEGLNLEKYNKYRRVYEQIVLHEGFHALTNRSGNLNDRDRIEFRDLWLATVEQFDPLSDMNKLFNPDGDYPNAENFEEFMDYIAAHDLDYMKITDYYFMHLEGFNSDDNVKNYRDELRNGLILLADIDIYKYFWPQEGMSGISDIFARLEESITEMDSFSQFVAKVMLENKEAILARKRSTFESEPNEFYYFTEKVLPYTLVHIALYKTDEMMKNLPEGKDPTLVKHFVQSWQKRLDRLVRGTATKELIADIFSEMLLDKEGKIDWENTKDRFDKMLDILKRNGQAFQPSQVVI